MKVHIPKDLYKQAKKKQDSYRQHGINKLMIDCVAEVYMDKDGRVPDLKDISRELRKISSQFEDETKNFGFGKRRGGWMN